MTAWELAIAAVLYLNVSWRYAQHNEPGMALAFVAYAVANVGFVWAAWPKKG